MKNNFKRIAAFLLALGVVIPQSTLIESFSVNAVEEIDASEFLCEESGIQADLEEVEKEIAVLAELNDGESPAISTNNDNVVEKIEGILSEESIESSWDVKELISSIDDLLGVENINQQLKFEDSSESLYNTVYKFKQYYEGIEIVNSSISIVVDKNTKIGKFLSSSFIPGFSIDINPDILSDEAVKIVVDKYSVGISQDPELVIFQNADEEHRLAWYIITDSTSPSEVYVDAKNGDILYEKMPYGANEEGDIAVTYTVEQNNPLPELFTVDIARDNDDADLYKLHDIRRNIYVLDSQVKSDDKNLVISKKYNDWTGYETELAVLHNVQRAYDFYKSLDWYGFDNENSDIFVLPSLIDENGRVVNNAYSYWGRGMAFGAVSVSGNNKNYGLCYDVVVHEYTHLVTKIKAEFSYTGLGEPSSLCEAYSDIMGEYAEGTDEWKCGNQLGDLYVRDLSIEKKYSNAEDFKKVEGHRGGMVIGHVAYLMQQYGVPDDYAMQIWYVSLDYLTTPNTHTFLGCRAAVLNAADDVFANNNVADEDAKNWKSKIRSAFDSVNVIPPLEIVEQPKDSIAAIGTKVKTSVEVEGSVQSYQWYLCEPGEDEFIKSSVTGKTYSYTMEEAKDGRKVYCVITDKDGNTVTTNTVTLGTMFITKQPSHAYAPIGGTVKTSVKALGNNLSYQWYVKNPGQNVFSKSSITKDVYECPMTEDRDGREIYCIISDDDGNFVKSDIVTLGTVVITEQPTSILTPKNEHGTISVTAIGDGLSYCWYLVYSPTYSQPMIYRRELTIGAGHQWFCRVTDKNGKYVDSDIVTLGPVVITEQPTNVQAKVGEQAKTKVSAIGEGDLTYEWWYCEPGETVFKKSPSLDKDYYSCKMTAAKNGRRIYCVVKDENGNSTFSNIVTIGLPLELKKDLNNVSVKMGEKLKTSIEVTGCGLTYTWYYKNKGMSDFKVTDSFEGNTYEFNKMTEERNGRQIYCVITDIFGNSVQTKTVTIGLPVEITEDLVDITAKFGEKVNFSVSAIGHGLSYEWYYKNKNMKDFEVTESFKTNNYAFDQITKARAGREVYCVITDIFGNKAQTKTIKIDLPTGYGDANCDGKLTEADYSTIQQSICNPDNFGLSEQGKINADVLGDDGVTLMDALSIQKYLSN